MQGFILATVNSFILVRKKLKFLQSNLVIGKINLPVSNVFKASIINLNYLGVNYEKSVMGLHDGFFHRLSDTCAWLLLIAR